MNSDKEFKGQWYLPGKPEEELSGHCYYNREDGCYIEIFGAFEGFMPKSKRHDIILGLTIEGKAITLVNCSRTNYRYNTSGVTMSKYAAQFALIGGHFESIEEIKFDTIYASITDLWKWVGVYGVNQYSLGFEEWTIDLKYQKPKPVYFDISDGRQVFFDFTMSAPGIKHVDKLEIDQRTYIGLRLGSPAGFEKLHQQILILYKFICVAYFDSPPILELHFSDSKDETGNRFKTELVYSDYYFNRSYKSVKDEHQFLFGYQNIPDDFAMMARRWFELFEKIEPAVNLLTILLLKKEYPLELKFLSATQAVETFHRNVYGGTEVSEEQHQQRIQSILENVPEEYSDWLREKLSYANEISLRARLRDVFKKTPERLHNELIPKKSNFISRVVNARNYFTHYNENLKNAVVSHGSLFILTEKLKIMLGCLILCELGLDKEKVVEFMPMHKVFPYIDKDE